MDDIADILPDLECLFEPRMNEVDLAAWQTAMEEHRIWAVEELDRAQPEDGPDSMYEYRCWITF